MSVGKRRPGKSVPGSDELKRRHKLSMLCVKTFKDKKQIRELPEVRSEMKAVTKLRGASEELRLPPVGSGETLRC